MAESHCKEDLRSDWNLARDCHTNVATHTTPDESSSAVLVSQMCATYVMATQLIDRQMLLEQFSQDKLDRDEV